VVAAAFVSGGLVAKTPALPDSRARAESAPQRVFVYGDSLVVQAEPYLASVANALDLEVTPNAFGGIAPCDALAPLAHDLRYSTPHLVVFAFSGNSFSDCMRDTNGALLTGGDVLARYRTDIETAVLIATHAGVPFVLASPPAREDGNGNWQELDTMFREIAAAHEPFVQYADAGAQIAPDGQFAATQRCLPFELNHSPSKGLCVSEGGSIGVRAADGVHFCSEASPPTPNPPSCSEYSSGALRYAIALVTAAKLDLDYLRALPAIFDPTTP
jgi:hypothetical protein